MIEPSPIFVGGTGRSGTTVIGRLLGQHPEYAVLPVEAKFHVMPRGIPGFLGGRDPDRVVEDIRGLAGTLTSITDAEDLGRDLERFKAGRDDRLEASRELVRSVFGRYARSVGCAGWVEMTPANVLYAGDLARMFPDLRTVHTIRDGRDVVASLLGLRWMTDHVEALRWWEARLLRAHNKSGELPPGALHVLIFEELVETDRERTFKALTDFLGWDSKPLRPFFDESVTPARANVGRWRRTFDAADAADLDRRYGESLRRLADAGLALPYA